jgi:hypothetical protein
MAEKIAVLRTSLKKPDERGGQINADDLDRNLPQINMPVGAVDLEKVDIHFEGKDSAPGE